VSGFAADWLALREPADARARNPLIGEALAGWLGARPRLRVLDLGAGTGANLRYLAPHLECDQDWLLCDHDPKLLEKLAPALLAWADKAGHAARRQRDGLLIEGRGFRCRVRWVQAELTDGVASAWLGDADLVTASALLDLVSSTWLDALIRGCRRPRVALLFSLSYDGRISWQPAVAGDGQVTAGLNRHQRQDKGFGPALGPIAAQYAADALCDNDFALVRARSDWRLGPSEGALQARLAADWAQVLAELEPAAADWLGSWLQSRSVWRAAGRSRLRVGHHDLFAVPRGWGS